MKPNKSVKNRLFITLNLLIVGTSFLTNCTARNSDIIEIGERMFIGQVNEIYLNVGDYLGKTIKLEGIFKKSVYQDSTYYLVVRYGLDDCCGDANIGFEVRWPHFPTEYPAEYSWVEATGMLKQQGPYLFLELSSLIVLDRRGSEFVRQ